MAKKAILIATDDLVDTPLFVEYCKKNHHRSVLACNFNELLDSLGMNQEIGLIILDLNLRQEGAIRIIPMLRTMDSIKQIPIITICDETTDEKIYKKLLDIGSDDFVRRPLYPSLIENRCNRCLKPVNYSTEDRENQYFVVRNLFRIVMHDISNLLINFELFMNSLDRPMSEDLRNKRTCRAKTTLAEISDLLKNAKMLDAVRSQKLVPKLKAVDLGKCISEISEIYTDRLAEKQLSLVGNWDQENLFVQSESTSLKHEVLGNLLTNAIKFSHPGSRINIDMEDSEPYVRIKIQDFGVGMSQQNIKNLFQEGAEKSRKGTRGEKGTGYGLPLAYQYICAYNGQIEVFSEKQVPESTNHGTTFIITLQKAIPN